MNRKTLSTLVSTLLIVSGATPVFAASNTAQISSTQAVNVTQPKIKLDAKTINAVNNPKLPSAARIPEKKIDPKRVPVIRRGQNQPNNLGKPSPTVNQPRMEVAAPVTIEKPQLETNFQSNRIEQIQEAINTARLLDHIEDIPGAGEMPGRVAYDPLADTTLGGHRPEVGDGLDVQDIVRELLLGRGGDFNSAGIGESGTRSGFVDPTRAVPGKPSQDSRAAGDGDGTDAIVGFFTGGDSDGLQSWLKVAGTVVGEVSSVAAFPITVVTFWDSMRGSNAGELNVSPEIAADTDGDGQLDMSRGDTRDHLQEDTDGDGVPDQSIDPDEPETDQGGADRNELISQPGEGQGWSNPNACNYNPITRKCHGNRGVSRDPQRIMDILTQPSTGEDGDTGPGSGAPSVGAVAVTNPDEFHQTGGSGGSGNTQPYDPRDPEEGIEPHESGPVRPGPSGPSTVATEETLDEAMGVAALE